ncbi:MAG: RnfH family protein [Betaproteobacteria bacterium]|nr:RnfH family protein [Betaproteobacteria bacterium]
MAEPVKQRVTVCYALPDVSFLIQLDVDAGTTIAEAIAASGVLARFPEIDLARTKLGVFGKLKPADTVLRDGDRTEIYRPLQADPMESRRRRARHKAAAEGRKG